jgi:hypothetical protein
MMLFEEFKKIKGIYNSEDTKVLIKIKLLVVLDIYIICL